MRDLGTLDGALTSAHDVDQSGTVVGSAGNGIGPLPWQRGPSILAGRQPSAVAPRGALRAEAAGAPAQRADGHEQCAPSRDPPPPGAESPLEVTAGC